MKKSSFPSSSSPGDPVRSTTVAEHERTALDWVREAGESERVIEDLDHYLRRRRNRRRSAMMAGSLGIMAMAAIFFWPSSREPAVASPVSVTMANAVILRPMARNLPDGSVVELDAGAEIETNFDPSFRRVTLRKGQAYFQVAKQAHRPFVVDAHGVSVRAVGTAFSVQLGSQAVEVLVTQGRVAVENSLPVVASSSLEQPTLPSPLTTIAAGNRIVVELGAGVGPREAPSVAPVSTAEMEELQAWRVPRLEFAGTPLAQALPMFNQHSRMRLVLGDPSIGKLQLSGVLRANNTESLLRLLEGDFGVLAEKHGEEIILRRP